MKRKIYLAICIVLGLLLGLWPGMAGSHYVSAALVNFQDYIPCKLTQTAMESFGTRMSPEDMGMVSSLVFEANGTGYLYIQYFATSDSPASESTYTFSYSIDAEGVAHLTEPGDLGEAVFRFNGQEGVLLYYTPEGILDEANRSYFRLEASAAQSPASNPAGPSANKGPSSDQTPANIQGGNNIPWAALPKPGQQLTLQDPTPQETDSAAPAPSLAPPPSADKLVRGEGAFNKFPGVKMEDGFMILEDPRAYFAEVGGLYDHLQDDFLKGSEEILAMVPDYDEIYAQPAEDGYFYFYFLNPSPYPIVEAWISLESISNPGLTLTIENRSVTMPGQWSRVLKQVLVSDEGYPMELEDLQVVDMTLRYQDYIYGVATFYFSVEDGMLYLTEYDTELIKGFYDLQPHQKEILQGVLPDLQPGPEGVAVTNNWGRDILRIVAVFSYQDGSQLVWWSNGRGNSYYLPAGASEVNTAGLDWTMGPNFDYNQPYLITEYQIVLAPNELNEDEYLQYTAYPALGMNILTFQAP